jgi:hypothetical protein
LFAKSKGLASAIVRQGRKSGNRPRFNEIISRQAQKGRSRISERCCWADDARLIYAGRRAPGGLGGSSNKCCAALRQGPAKFIICVLALKIGMEEQRFVPNPTVEEIGRIYLAHRVFEAGVIAELARRFRGSILDRIESHLGEERAAVEREDRAASVRLSGEFHLMLVDSLSNPDLSRFLRELLARSSLMVSAFEPARLLLCGVDEHAAIAAALREGDAEKAIALSGEHFHHIEERLAEGLVERSEIPIEEALSPCSHRVTRKPTFRANAHS